MTKDEVKKILSDEFEEMIKARVRDKQKHGKCESWSEAYDEAIEEINSLTNCQLIRELLL